MPSTRCPRSTIACSIHARRGELTFRRHSTFTLHKSYNLLILLEAQNCVELGDVWSVVKSSHPKICLSQWTGYVPINSNLMYSATPIIIEWCGSCLNPLPTTPRCTTSEQKNNSNFLCCSQLPNRKQTPYPTPGRLYFQHIVRALSFNDFLTCSTYLDSWDEFPQQLMLPFTHMLLTCECLANIIFYSHCFEFYLRNPR